MKNSNYISFFNNYQNIGNKLLILNELLFDDNHEGAHDFILLCDFIDDYIAREFQINTFNFFYFIVFEGDRCSGKDIIINELAKDEKFSKLPRINNNNPAWKKLNDKKQNCYFKLENILDSVLLWYSDLAFRVSNWEINDSDLIYLVNRYCDSVNICIISNYCNELSIKEIERLTRLLNNFEKFFPISEKTIVLDVDHNTQVERQFQSRNRIFTKEEADTAVINIELFKMINKHNTYIIDATENFENVLENIKNILYNIKERDKG